MVKLHFKDIKEFNGLFKNKSEKVTDAIVEGIEKALLDNDKSASLFEVSFQDYDNVYEIGLSQSQWEVSLQSCLDHYHKLNLSDKVIDTWKLLEITKVL